LESHIQSLDPDPYALTRDSPYAHCVCVVGKNYRLQNIQLSKNPPSLPLGSSGPGQPRNARSPILVTTERITSSFTVNANRALERAAFRAEALARRESSVR
jgi:hypothetical protein